MNHLTKALACTFLLGLCITHEARANDINMVRGTAIATGNLVIESVTFRSCNAPPPALTCSNVITGGAGGDPVTVEEQCFDSAGHRVQKGFLKGKQALVTFYNRGPGAIGARVTATPSGDALQGSQSTFASIAVNNPSHNVVAMDCLSSVSPRAGVVVTATIAVNDPAHEVNANLNNTFRAAVDLPSNIYVPVTRVNGHGVSSH